VCTETRVEGSRVAGASSVCPLGALQVPMAAGICAGLVAHLVFGSTGWLDEVAGISSRRECSSRSGRCR